MPFCPNPCLLLDLNSYVHSVSNIHYFSRWSAFFQANSMVWNAMETHCIEFGSQTNIRHPIYTSQSHVGTSLLTHRTNF